MYNDMFLTFPNSIKLFEYCFKLNSDDYSRSFCKDVDKLLKSKNLEFTKTRQYSQIRMMSWAVYKIKSSTPILSFEQNVNYCKSLFN
jgi:hypothetical protein